jgi:hypothetical protein
MIRTSLALLLALGASRLEGVPLRFKPTDSTAKVLNETSRAFKLNKVQVKPFTDERDDKQLIGRNSEEDALRTVTTKDDVGAWCATAFGSLLRDAGVPLVDQGAQYVVSGKVTRFMVDETNMYNGVVAMLITIQDAKGKQLWTGLVTGEAKRWGRSYKAENYMETLSDALVRAVNAIVTDPKLNL